MRSGLKRETTLMHIVAEKYGLSILMVLTAWLILFSTTIRAEVISEHNEQHAAEMAAQNQLFNSGCVRTNITRIARFSVESVDDYFVVRGNSMKVECVEMQSQKRVFSVTWEPPTHREDGSEILPDQIAGYQMLRDGQIIDMSPCCEFMTTDIEGLSIRAVDTRGVVSSAVDVTL